MNPTTMMRSGEGKLNKGKGKGWSRLFRPHVDFTVTAYEAFETFSAFIPLWPPGIAS